MYPGVDVGVVNDWLEKSNDRVSVYMSPLDTCEYSSPRAKLIRLQNGIEHREGSHPPHTDGMEHNIEANVSLKETDQDYSSASCTFED